MPAYATKPALRTIDLSTHGGPTEAKVVVIPLPAKTIGIIFGVRRSISWLMHHRSHSRGIQQRTAGWVQRYNTYVLDTNYFVKDPQALWQAATDNSRFDITEIKPPGFDKDPAVLSIGPFNDDNYIAVYTSHLKPGQQTFAPSDPHHSSVRPAPLRCILVGDLIHCCQFQYDFTIGGKNAISFTLVSNPHFRGLLKLARRIDVLNIGERRGRR